MLKWSRRRKFTASFVLLLFAVPIVLKCSSSLSDKRPFVSTSQKGCQLRRPNPFDPSILEFIVKPAPLHCDGEQHELTYLSEDEWLHINFTTVHDNQLSVACFYRCYDRVNDDDENLRYDQWVRFNDTVRPGCEFVETRCERTSFPTVTIYRNNHNQILKRERASSAAPSTKKSVILIVFDSVSHSSFVRNMPKSLQILQSKYKSHIFDGMSKVGDQSFPNAVAFLAGRDHRTEFGDVKGFFDEHPLIWKNFEKANYTTYYAEDYPNFNLFNYLAKGFKRKPVHHYFRPFWLNVYGSFLHRRSKFLCYGNQAMHNIELNYLSQFLRKYRDSPKFALNWLTELGHDYMNNVNVADDDFATFLTNHYDDLKNSFLFVLSDHGHRFDSIRRTAIGRIEERLPFFSMHIPMDLQKKFPEIVKTVERNTQILTTFWDFYVTMRDILDISQGDKWDDFKDTKISLINTLYSSRGLSLLRPIKDRNCKQAGVPDEYCTCYAETLVDTRSILIRQLANKVVEHLNYVLTSSKSCAQLVLSRIFQASVIENDDLGSDQHYRLTIEAKPSKGIFEALLNYNDSTKNFEVSGIVNRVNSYGNQSICVQEQELRKYCYCIDESMRIK